MMIRPPSLSFWLRQAARQGQSRSVAAASSAFVDRAIFNRHRANRTPTVHGLPERRFSSPAAAAAAAEDDGGTEGKLLSKVLIANRGEISKRISRTCHKLGIPTVAIHSTVDANAPFVKAANEAVCVGTAASSDSYLNEERIIKAIKDTGADAVHPGYGFFSENGAFATKLQDEMGIAWLGPSASAIRDMGDKLRSKEIAQEAGVSTIPGFEGTIESVQHALDVSKNIVGYPVLIKAAAGGGGKGMRICYNDVEVKDAYPLAKSEAKSFFADDRLLIEKYVENPHHIEFQVLCNPSPDGLQVVVFPERECSIQRRNQKIIEESPSCLLSPETRQKMANQVRKLCDAVGYTSAGTVEFLVDEQENFFFLEMNTRLQVEHPITEAVGGVDLVKAMLWVAAGRGLPDELLKPYTEFMNAPGRKEGEAFVMPSRGHAIEARICAEDPTRSFLPSTGALLPYVEPKCDFDENFATAESYLRIDSGVVEGQVISAYYDPMISKLIAYAPTRSEAISKLSQGLGEYVIEGVKHNARLVNAVLNHEAFKKGDTPTSFLGRHIPEFKGVELTGKQNAELAVAAVLIEEDRKINEITPNGKRTVVASIGGMFGAPFRVTLDSNEMVAVVEQLSEESTETWTIPYGAFEPSASKNLVRIELDNVTRTIQKTGRKVTGETHLQMLGANTMVLIQEEDEYELSKLMHEPAHIDTSNVVLSPMPGMLVSYDVSAGDVVEQDQELCIVEAMKMQNIIRATRAGKIASLNVNVGSSLMADDVIITYADE